MDVNKGAVYRRLPLTSGPNGDEPPDPGSRSASMCVPPGVPSVTHGSSPCTPSFAVKKTRVPFVAKYDGADEQRPGQTSATMTVPAAVPSVFQSSAPCVSS